MSYYNGMNEYRWSYIWSTQGHYNLHKNLENAIKSVKTVANKKDDVVIIQGWKPKTKNVYIITPKKLKGKSKKTIISYYKDEGYDVDYIKPSNYIIKN